MDSTIRRLSGSAYAVIGPEGATNFAIVKSSATVALRSSTPTSAVSTKSKKRCT